MQTFAGSPDPPERPWSPNFIIAAFEPPLIRSHQLTWASHISYLHSKRVNHGVANLVNLPVYSLLSGVVEERPDRSALTHLPPRPVWDGWFDRGRFICSSCPARCTDGGRTGRDTEGRLRCIWRRAAAAALLLCWM